MKTTYYVIYCDELDEKYMRVAYDLEEGRLIYNGYSPMTNWMDATLFDNKDVANQVLSENKPGANIKGQLKLITIDVEIHND